MRYGMILMVGLLALMISPAYGWSNKDHIQLTRIAVDRLLADPTTPPAMQTWLRQAEPDAHTMDEEEQWFMHRRVGGTVQTPRDAAGLSYWATIPDALAASEPRDSTVSPFGVHERMLHFVDLELLLPPGHVKGYHHDLSGKPTLASIPTDMNDPRWKKAGMLPFRIVDSYDKLVAAFKSGRLNLADGDDNAIKWAGFLAHYLADNTQPHHATLDYRSQSYFANRKTAPNVHSALEYQMYNDYGDAHYNDLRKEYWPLFIHALQTETDPAADTSNLWLATLETSLKSYDALPLIGLAAMHASHQAGTPDHPTGPNEPLDLRAFYHYQGSVDGQSMTVMQMRARQTAWAVLRIEKLLKQAWNEAHSADAASR